MILDLIYLALGGNASKFIESLRLLNLMNMNVQSLRSFAKLFGKPKLRGAEEYLELFIEGRCFFGGEGVKDLLARLNMESESPFKDRNVMRE